jgi:hypothetical protein
MSVNRIGGFSALIQCVLWVTFAGFVIVVNPLVGLASPNDLQDPDRLLPALHQHPALIVFPGLDAAVGASLLVIVVVVRQRLRTAGSSLLDPLSAVCGVLAAAQFVLLSISRVAVLPLLADLYTTNHSGATELFLLSNALHEGVSNATRLALGAWWILVSALALRAAVLPKWLVYFGIALGVINCVSAFVMPVAAPNLLLVPIYFAALAFHLLHREPSPSVDPQNRVDV